MCGAFRLAILLVALTSGCGGPKVDLTKNLEILDVSSGWLDVGLVNGQNKLVPSITFKLKNTSDQQLIVLQINALFRRLNEDEEWGTGFKMVARPDGLAAGATSDAITVNSNLGYTGTEPRSVMLENSRFVDARVELFAKYGSIQWVRMGEYPIARQLITQ